MNNDQLNYLKNELFSLTLMGTVQRANLYQKESSESQRKAFRRALRAELERLVPQYWGVVSERRHLANIESLANTLSGKHSKVLTGKRFRIGSAQKALNLYLKYMWCLGYIRIPPHCPFDARILSKVTDCRDIRWTQLDSMRDYENIVRCAKATARGIPLAEWELGLYNATEIG